MNNTELTLLLTGISALGALGAAIAAWLSARATRRAAEAQLFSSHYAEYGEPEMLRALRLLRMWRHDHGDKFSEKWREALEKGDKNAHDVDKARWFVKHYFAKALHLYDSGYVSRKFLINIISVDGINILYDVVQPLGVALNPKTHDAKLFPRLRELVGRSGTGVLIDPIPAGPRAPSADTQE